MDTCTYVSSSSTGSRAAKKGSGAIPVIATPRHAVRYGCLLTAPPTATRTRLCENRSRSHARRTERPRMKHAVAPMILPT
eukprot:scaffold51605_cov64-Phaeocystis_antarctica.AAC.9